MQIAPAGDNAALVELGNVTAAHLHASAAAVRRMAGVLACIPGHSSLYVVFEDAPDTAALRSVLRDAEAVTAVPQRVHRIRVCFDGEDLPELLARVSREEFLSRISTLRLTARYLGFRGGFAYLDAWPDEWSMPRRTTSRPVRRGAFAVAGNVAGVYPIDTPGGWNVLGRTDADLENAITAGDEIAIEPVDALPVREPGMRGEALRLSRAELLAPALVARVEPEDWSRVSIGLPPGGAFDDVAAAVARSAVRGDVELLECALAAPRLRFMRDAVVAWCPPSLDVRIQRLRAGEELAIGRISGGLRGYLAIGDAEGEAIRVDRVDRHVIRAIRGPHDVAIGNVECEVTPQLDRVGIRLRPLQQLALQAPADLSSCGMQCGTVQLHPDGSLLAMGPDHPVTGGYLQPMTIVRAERWKLAQLMPGERVRIVVEDLPGK